VRESGKAIVHAENSANSADAHAHAALGYVDTVERKAHIPAQ
jgi:hypothetical protein